LASPARGQRRQRRKVGLRRLRLLPLLPLLVLAPASIQRRQGVIFMVQAWADVSAAQRLSPEVAIAIAFMLNLRI
jgi:hypothetical protein